MNDQNEKNCLEVKDLKMYFPVKNGLLSKPRQLKAVDGVSFSIPKGKTMGSEIMDSTVILGSREV